MKTIALFLLLISTSFGQEFLTVKSLVTCLDSKNIVLFAPEGEISHVIKVGQTERLLKPTKIDVGFEAEAELLFSNGVRVHLEPRTTIGISVAEQDVSKDEDGTVHLSGEGIGIVFNLKVEQGRVDFLLSSVPNESSTFIVSTDHADLEIHATRFTVVISTFGFTRVHCQNGYILVTTKNNKQEKIENEEVTIHGKDNTNEFVIRSKFVVLPTFNWTERKLQSVKWDGKTLTF